MKHNATHIQEKGSQNSAITEKFDTVKKNKINTKDIDKSTLTKEKSDLTINMLIKFNTLNISFTVSFMWK